MAKKIFKIIGIVLGSVTAFVGAVIGVLAIQGKFKKPVVYPTRLSFLDAEQTIVVGDDPDRIYSFVLNGYADGSENDVNQKSCYLNFVANTGSNLITLVDARGNNLQNNPDKYDSAKNRYIIDCNELTYFKVKPVTAANFVGNNFGKVMLQATDSRSLVQSNTLTIWIDREVKSIMLDDSLAQSSTNNGAITQTLELGLEVKEYFNYKATPEFSLNPISREEAKQVELYYHDLAQADYVLIDKTSVNNYSFLGYDQAQDKFYFSHDEAQQELFEFKIAVFPTYAKKSEFESNPSNAYVAKHQRINQMVNTTLLISVSNSQVEDVGFHSQGISLNLFDNNNYITLSGKSGQPNANDNNLDIYMMREGQPTTNRFNEVGFGLDVRDNWLDTGIEFESEDKTNTFSYSNTTKEFIYNGNRFASSGYELNIATKTLVFRNAGNTTHRFELNLSPCKLSENFYQIEQVKLTTLNGTTLAEPIILNPTSGAIFVQEEEKDSSKTYSFYRLISGSYLDFFILDRNNGTQTLATQEEFARTVTYVAGTSGLNKSFNIVAKSTLPEGQSLVLGLLVVNATGGALFSYLPVNISAIDLDFTTTTDTLDLDVTYLQTGEDYLTTYGYENFSNLINITRGSYRAGVLVTPETDAYYNEETGRYEYNVDVLEGVYFVQNETRYAIVGYIEKGEFVNAVRVRAGANNNPVRLNVLQLKGGFNETAEQIVQHMIENSEVYLKYAFGYTIDAVYDEYYTYIKLSNNNGIMEATPSANLYTLKDNQVATIGLSVTSVDLTGTDILFNVRNGETNEIIKPTFFGVNRGTDTAREIILATDDENALIKPVRVFLTAEKTITARVHYPFIKEGINFNYNAANVGLGTDKYVFANGTGSNLTISVVENTPVEGDPDHTLTLTSPIKDLFYNMELAGFNFNNVKINLYNSNGTLLSESAQNIVITAINSTKNGELVISYRVEGALSAENNYLKFAITFGGETIESVPIYIQSTLATKITFAYDYDEENKELKTINLYNSLNAAENGEYYVQIELGYNDLAQEYTYNYSLIEKIGSATKVVKDFGNGSVFNTESSAELKSGFYVLPAYGELKQALTYQTDKTNVLSFDGGIKVNMVGDCVVSASSGAITSYIAVKVVKNDALTLTDNHFTSTENVQFDLSQVVSMELKTSATTSKSILNSKTARVENLKVLEFSSGEELEVVPPENGTDTPTESGLDIRTKNGKIVVLSLRDNGQWTFTRQSMQSAGLKIGFDVVTKLGIINAEVEFVSNVQINTNPDWKNFYQYTTVRLFEESKNNAPFNHSAIFKINNNNRETTEISVNVKTPNEATKAANENFVFEETGLYTFTFLSNGLEVDSKSLTVLPNIVAETNNIKLQTASSYSIYTTNEANNGICNFYKYDTSIIYGLNVEGVGITMYGEEGTKTELTNLESSKLNVSSNLGIGSNSLLTQAGGNLNVLWHNDLRLNRVETITLSYDGNEISKFDVTITNKFYSPITTGIEIVSGIPFSSDTLNFVNNSSVNDSFTLTSITHSTLNDEAIKAIFNQVEGSTNFVATLTSLSGRVDTQTNPVLILTYIRTVGEETQTLTITVNKSEDETLPKIVIKPYLPEGKDTVFYSQAAEEQQRNLLTELFDISTADYTNLVRSFIVKSVDDLTAFTYGELATGYVHVNDFVGEMCTVTITYLITYTNGTTHEFTREITIYNRLEIATSYPFADLVENNTQNLVFDSEADATRFGAQQTTTTNVYSASGFNYEVVNVGETITFDYDETFNLKRVNVTNKKGGAEVEDNYTIEIVAHTSRGYMSDYRRSGAISIDQDSHSITFKPSTTFPQSSYGYLVVKLQTTSGYVEYYTLYIYSKTNTSFSGADYLANKVLQAKNLDVVDGTNVLGVDIKSTTNTNDFVNLTFNETTIGRISFYLLDATTLNSEEEIALTKNSKVNDLTLNASKNYAHIKLGMLYLNGTTKVYLGSLNYYVAPETTETLDSTKTGYAHKIEGIENGEYTYTISATTKEVTNPFTYNGNAPTKVELSNFSSKVSGVVGVEGTTIKIDKNVQEDLTFVATYSFGETNAFVLKVYYTISALNVSTSKATFALGGTAKFSKEEGFNDKIYLEQYLGNYNRSIALIVGEDELYRIDLSNGTVTDSKNGNAPTSTTLNINGINVNYIHTESSNRLQVSLGVDKSLTMEFTVKYLNIDSQPEKNFSVTINPGVYIEQSTGKDSGYNNETLLGTILNDKENDLFTRKDASHLTFVREEVTQGDNSLYYKYTIEAKNSITIYTKEAKDLSFILTNAEGKDVGANYIVKEERTDADSSYNQTISFVHTATDTNLQLKIGVGNYKETVAGSLTEVERILHIQLAKSYSDIVANYLTHSVTELVSTDEQGRKIGEVNHENVITGKTIDDLFETLFEEELNSTNKLGNSRRIVLLDKDGKEVDANFAKMGFKDKDNANYIRFTGNTGITVTTQQTENEANETITTQSAKFADVQANTLAGLNISNNAGIGIVYTYQIMVNKDTSNGITGIPASDNGVSTTTSGTEDAGDYTVNTSVLIKDDENVSIEAGYKLDEKHIASLDDSQNLNFNILDMKRKISASDSDNITIKNLVPKYQENGIIYTIEQGGYTVTIRMAKNREIYVSFTRGEGIEKVNFLHLNFALYTDSGLVTKNYNLVFVNATVEEQTGAKHSVNAGDDIQLDEMFKIKSNTTTGTGIGLDNVSISSVNYRLDNTTYSGWTNVSNNRYECNVFTFDKSKGTITTNAVPSQARVEIYVDVKGEFNDVSITIGSLRYEFDIERNLQFKVNGSGLSTGDDEIVTKYIMTPSCVKGTTQDKSFYNFTYLADDWAEKVTIDTIEYQKKIKIELQDLYGVAKDSNLIDISEKEADVNYTPVGVRVDKASKTITIPKDYTGEIQLELSVNTGVNGTYSIGWVLDVRGFVKLDYIGSEDTIQSGTDGSGFVSNEPKKAIDSSRAQALKNGTGLYISTTLNNEKVVGVGSTETAVAKYEYVILPNSNVVDADKAFEGQTPIPGETDFITSPYSLELKLPTVQQSDEREPINYLVVYRIKVLYFKIGEDSDSYRATTDWIYVTYRVHNNRTITQNKTSIDVDTQVKSKGNDLYLELFKLVENISYLDKDNNSITLSIITVKDGDEYKYQLTTDAENSYTSNTEIGNYTIDRVNKKLTVNGETDEYEITNIKYTNGNNAVFSSQRKSWEDFIKDLDSIDTISITGATGLINGDADVDDLKKVEGLKLEYIADGSFGIKLYDNTSKDTPLKFSGQLTGTLNLNSTSGTICSIQEFKLTTKTQITAKAENITLASMFLTTEMDAGARSYRTEYIVGIGTPSNDWFNNATNVEYDSTTDITNDKGEIIGKNNILGTLTLSNGNKYYLKKVNVTYGATEGNTKLYSLEKEFYYLESADGTTIDTLTTIDYTSSIQPNYFWVTLNTAEDGTLQDSTFDLNIIKIYKVDANGKFYRETSNAVVSFEETPTIPNGTYENNKIIVSVQSYKNAHPSETTLRLSFVTSEGLKFDVVFQLPEEPTEQA